MQRNEGAGTAAGAVIERELEQRIVDEPRNATYGKSKK
jgi:hypothetical protein